MIGRIKRRRRLEFIRRNTATPRLKYYTDPETGKQYVGHGRWDPCLIRSRADMLGIKVEP